MRFPPGPFSTAMLVYRRVPRSLKQNPLGPILLSRSTNRPDSAADLSTCRRWSGGCAMRIFLVDEQCGCETASSIANWWKLLEVAVYNFLNLKRMNLRFLVAHVGCLTVRLTERSTVRLTGSLFVTVRLTERATVRLTVRQSVRQGVRHDKIRLILMK